MSRAPTDLSPEARELLEQERSIPAVPAAVRARAIARARAALTAGLVQASPPSRAAIRARWAAAVALVCVAGVAVGATAYQIHARVRPAPGARPDATAVPTVSVPVRAPGPAASPPPAASTVVPSTVVPSTVVPSTEAHAVGPHRPSFSDAVQDELRLLRRARGAVAREDFAAALAPIIEHSRRFKNGRLAEEREALRVKALVGLGRMEDARRAAAAFEARFPQSVLLPAVSQMPAARP